MTQVHKLAVYTKLAYFLFFLADRYFYYKDSFKFGNFLTENIISPEKKIKLNFFNHEIFFKTETLLLSPHPLIFVLNDYSSLAEKDSIIIRVHIITFVAYDLLISILCFINIFKNNSLLLSFVLTMDNLLKLYTIWCVEFSNIIEELARQKELRRFFEVFIPGMFAESFNELQGVMILTLNEFKSFIINIVMIIFMIFVKILDKIDWEDQINEKINMMETKQKND